MEGNERTPQERFLDRIGIAVGGAVSDAADAMVRAQKLTGAVHRVSSVLGRIAGLEHGGDIEGVAIGSAYEPELDASASMYIDASKQDTPLLREIVAAGITSKIEKRASYMGTQLRARFVVDRVEYVIEGYKPATCRVVEEKTERAMEPTEYEIRDGKVYQVGRKFKTVCEPEEKDEIAE